MVVTMLGIAALLVSACGTSDEPSGAASGSVAPGGEEPLPTSPPTPSAPDAVSVADLAEAACDDAPTRLGADAEVLTSESWLCTKGSESVRIDRYEDQAQQDTALRTLESFYSDTGDTRPMSELPFVCGESWGIGVDFNTTRDRVIAELNESGIAAGTC